MRTGPAASSPARPAPSAAAPSPSPHRTYPVVPRAGDRAFVRTFVAALVAGLLGVAALDLLADPLGVFGVRVLPRATWDDRDAKARLFLAHRARGAALVLGSSRTMKIDPRCVAERTGTPAFNFGVSAGRPEDWLAIYRLARDSAPGVVRRIVLGVEPDVLLDDFRLGFYARQSPYLRPYLDAAPASPAEVPAALLGQEAFAASLRAVAALARGADAAPATRLRDDGYLTYVADEAAVRAGRFDQRARLEAFAARVRPAFSDTARLSPARVALLARLLADARADGVRVDAFVPPAHPAVFAALRGTALEARLGETVALLRALERRGLLVYHETSRPGPLGVDPAGYFDGYHMMAGNAARVTAAVLGGGCAVQ